MKCFSILFVLLLIIQNSFSQNTSLGIYKIYFDHQLRSWTKSFKNFQLSHFKRTDSSYFEESDYMDIRDLKSFYKLYKPALSFSTDSSQFIDIYSYWLNLEKKGNKVITNAEVDQAVSLCNLRKHKWTQILFCGVSIRIDDVLWATNTKFILAGSVMDENNIFHPKIYIGDINKQIFFAYTDSSCAANRISYTSPKFKKLNIQDK